MVPCRFVRTAEYAAEDAVDKILYRSTFGTQPAMPLLKKLFNTDWAPSNFMNLKLKNNANTNVIYHGGKLLVLFEAGEGHAAVYHHYRGVQYAAVAALHTQPMRSTQSLCSVVVHAAVAD
jgi:carotenoid cleavage dioxygenase-like enzyme